MSELSLAAIVSSEMVTWTPARIICTTGGMPIPVPALRRSRPRRASHYNQGADFFFVQVDGMDEQVIRVEEVVLLVDGDSPHACHVRAVIIVCVAKGTPCSRAQAYSCCQIRRLGSRHRDRRCPGGAGPRDARIHRA